MKARIVLSLFALPFLGVGAWMLWSLSSNFTDAWRMQSWRPVEARLIGAGYETHPGDDADTYKAYAEYTYNVDGREYRNDRVGISGGGDNIGDYQRDMGSKLASARSRGETITVFVDPHEPRDSIIDRELRWGLVGFKAIFLFIFGGVGLGLIIYAWKAREQKDAAAPEYRDRPWLANEQWLTATIRSNSKSSMYFTWGFAALWNLASAPVPFLLGDEVLEKENYAALVGLLFPLVGIGLFVWAVRRTLEWRRFGPAPLTLDPFPGAIGGHVGGTIDVNLPYDTRAGIVLTLTNVLSYVTGSGDDRSRQEKAKWQDRQLAHAEPGGRGMKVSFRFDVPEGLAESDATQRADSYHLWRLNLKAELPGIDIDRDYEIPVYATGQESRQISARAVESARRETDKMDDLAVRKAVRVHTGIGGKEIHYPAGRNIGAAVAGLAVGAAFGGVGWFLGVAEGHVIFGSIFGAVGAVAVLASSYTALNSLLVSRDSTHLKTVRRVMGIPIRRRSMRCDELVRFSKDSSFQSQSGKTHVVHYSIYAEDARDHKIVVGEGFRGDSVANAAIRLLARELALTPKQGPTSTFGNRPFDVLAADN